jgi:hypothetical protein
MPKFISGGLKIDIKFNDRTDKYQAKVCAVHGRECETVTVGPPASGSRSAHGRRLAVDDPRAYKQAAHAAISFARDSLRDQAATNTRGSGWLVKPPRRGIMMKRRRR